MGRSTSFFIVGLLAGLLAAGVVFAFVAAQKDEAPGGGRITVLRLAHGLDESHPVHAGMVHMQKVLREKSGGTMDIKIFPNEQLGNEKQCIELVQQGVLAMTKTSTSPLESFVPSMAVFSMPYVFRDEAHYWKVLEGEIGKEMLEAGQSRGLLGLCYYDAGSRSFYTISKPIEKPADLEGMKIRVQQSQTAMRMISVMGGAPTPIPWGELYTALQQGMVDGAENNIPSFYSNRHFEVCKHLSLDEHTRVPDMLVISTQRWAELTPTQQRWLREAAAESSRYQRKLWDEKTVEALEAVKKEGVTVYRPAKEPFMKAVEPMHAEVDNQAVKQVMQRIAEVK